MTNIQDRATAPEPSARFRGTDADLRALREDLEQHRNFRVGQLRELTAPMSTAATTPTGDPRDAVTLALRIGATAVLAEIDDALFRIQDNRYGLCQACGTAIPLDRLQALPMVRRCGPCQHTKDTTNCVLVESRLTSSTQTALDIVDEWGRGSFPASDPPANW